MTALAFALVASLSVGELPPEDATRATQAVDIPTPFSISPVVDGVGTGGLALFYGAVSLVRVQRPFAASCGSPSDPVCSRSHLLALDRWAVGRSSTTWTHLSDGLEIGGTLLPHLLVGLETWRGGSSHAWSSFGTDALVILQAQLVAGTISNLIKIAVDVPRPRQYEAETYKAVTGSEDSFPCGHCVAVSVAAAAYTTRYWLKHPKAPSRWAVLGVAGALTLVGSYARIEAGAHFPSDAIAGVALGATSGVLIPYLHRRSAQTLVTLVPNSRRGMDLAVAF